MMNYGLVLISPMILVRLLSVEDFGRYREFLVYTTLLGGIAAFGINSSLLRFVPGHPDSYWRFVNQAALMTLASSVVVAGAMLALDAALGGKVVGEYALPTALYVLLFVNLDFWEFLWLAEKRSSAVLRYTTARLVARIIVVTTSAALTRQVTAIVWSLVCLEAVRLTLSAIGFRSRSRRLRNHGPAQWREQLQYCLPFGAALVVTTINKSMGALFVAKLLGPAALAHYTIGTYLQPVIATVRNSISDVVLPELSARKDGSPRDRLLLWRRTTVVTAVILFAASVVLGRFAEIIVITLFSETYLPAVALFQLYMLTFLRETLDFGVPLRAVNRNKPILHSSLVCFVVRIALMAVLIPFWGLLGAVVAMVASRFCEGAYLGVQTAGAFDIPLRELAPWSDLLKVLGAAVLSGLVLYGDFWTQRLGLFGLVPAAALYGALYVFLLTCMGVSEVGLLLRKLRAAPALVLRRRAQ